MKTPRSHITRTCGVHVQFRATLMDLDHIPEGNLNLVLERYIVFVLPLGVFSLGDTSADPLGARSRSYGIGTRVFPPGSCSPPRLVPDTVRSQSRKNGGSFADYPGPPHWAERGA